MRVWRGIILSVCIFILAGCVGQNNYSENGSVSILFAGNSHIRTGDVPGQLQELARLHGIVIEYVDISRNGVNLDGTLRDNAIRKMQNRNFNYVVFQASGRSIRATYDIDGFLDDIRLFSEQIRENGATPVLYGFGWGRVSGQINKELQNTLSQAHKQAAYENNLILINAGDAWLYAIEANPGISLFSRDGIHANNKGAFLTASVFMATLFDLDIANVPAGSLIDNLPMLNILTILGLIAILFVIKRRLLPLKISLVMLTLIALFQIASFFPHMFIFAESGNRIILLYFISFFLVCIIFYSIYQIVQKNKAKKYALCILACAIIYSLTFIPALELRSPLYRGDYAINLARTALNFVN